MGSDNGQVFTWTIKLALIKAKEILKSLLICEIFLLCSQQDYLFCSDNFGHV